MDAEKLASMIDHTLLKPEATEKDFEKLCDEARRPLMSG
jgi:deoxyribose-phosphate aldolase